MAKAPRADTARFRRLFDGDLLRELESLQLERSRLRARADIPALILALLGLLLFGVGILADGKAFSGALAFFFLAYQAYWFYFRHLCKPLRPRYQERIVQKVVRFARSDLAYVPEGQVNFEVVEKSCLFDAWSDWHAGYLFRGRQGDARYEFCRIALKATVGKATSEVFTGFFLAGGHGGTLRGATVLMPDFAEAKLGWLGRSLQELDFTRPATLLNFEDPDFENTFAIYGTDPVEARLILSPVRMRALTAFARDCGVCPRISFIRNRVFAAIPSPVNHFELPPSGRECDFDWQREGLRDIRACLDLLQTLQIRP